MNRILILITIILLTIITWHFQVVYSNYQIIEENQKREVNLETKLSEEQNKSEELPVQVLYDVPFTPQAPFGDWDDIRQDTGCEEASIFMAIKWVNEEDLTFEEAEQEIIAMSEFEEENYGHHHDASSQDTLKLLRDYYGYDKGYLEYGIGAEDIKLALVQGNLVIVPINGQIVGNPYYTLPGPFQHKLLIRGYDDLTQEFITNDPGTKRGEGYRYDYQVLENALMDYPTGFNEPVDQIRSAMIVITK